ncbi:redoxin domain-containing protein [Glaciecola sp. XM2]|uniref:redoxin domain-containing protein n=1 Tax=Glaciecola sp. XM2 TaxID=1914931 RepID=UPI002033072A|nr:redoxin domain-containing protein [Glaciecola sp. XM2]
MKVENKKLTFKQALAKNYRTYLRDITLFVLIVVGITYWQTKDMLETDGTVIVEQQNLVSLDGLVMPMLADDKPNLVYFFAPWCKICSLSIDNLDYLNEDKVNVVVIALDYSSTEEVEAFVAEHDVTMQVLYGHADLKRQFQIKGYPSYYLIDESFTIVSRSYGYSTAVGLKLRETFGS